MAKDARTGPGARSKATRGIGISARTQNLVVWFLAELGEHSWDAAGLLVIEGCRLEVKYLQTLGTRGGFAMLIPKSGLEERTRIQGLTRG
jgi:hypothetical protein